MSIFEGIIFIMLTGICLFLVWLMFQMFRREDK